MLRRARFIFFLIFQAIWFVFVLPGHTRGIVSFAKSDARPAIGRSCCSEEDAPAKPVSPSSPTKEQKSKCAICFYTVGLTTAIAIDLRLPELGLLEILPVNVPVLLAAQQHILTYYACGPPAFC